MARVTLPEQVVKALAAPAADRSEAERRAVVEHFSGIDAADAKRIVAKLEKLKKTEPAKPELSVRVLVQRTKDPRPTLRA